MLEQEEEKEEEEEEQFVEGDDEEDSEAEVRPKPSTSQAPGCTPVHFAASGDQHCHCNLLLACHRSHSQGMLLSVALYCTLSSIGFASLCSFPRVQEENEEEIEYLGDVDFAESDEDIEDANGAYGSGSDASEGERLHAEGQCTSMLQCQFPCHPS